MSSVVAARAGFLRKGARDMKCVVELIHGNVLRPLKKTPASCSAGEGGMVERQNLHNLRTNFKKLKRSQFAAVTATEK